jgi:acetyltransferase-like isoleucine patch superfamily enzyme
MTGPPAGMAPALEIPRQGPPGTFLGRWVRRFGRTSYAIVVLVLYLLAASAMGLAAAPALALGSRLFALAARLHPVQGWCLRGLALALGWFVFGMALLGVVAVYNRILPTRLRAFRGSYYTLEAAPWFLHNGLFYLVRFTFLPFVTLTPYGVWFLKAMGMTIGRHAFVNTEYLSDPSFITLGDDVVVGGSVRICAHYGGGGNLVIAPVVVGHRATLGLACCVMGDVVIGEDAVVLPHSVLLPGSRVGAGEVWGGVPARPIAKDEMDALKLVIRGGAES